MFGRSSGHRRLAGSTARSSTRCTRSCAGAGSTARTKVLVDHRTRLPHDCDHRCNPHQCKPLAESTLRKVHYLLSGAYKKAVHWNWVTLSPMEQTEPPAPSPANPQPPNAADAAAILNQAWRNDVDWGTQVWLLMITGSRRGEICGLRWRHIDLDSGVLHMEKAIGQDDAEVWEKDTKTHQDRRIVLDPDTVELLTEHWERCATRARELGFDLSRDAFVFSQHPDGSAPLKPASVTQRYRRLVHSLGLDTHLHALRHYSATELIGAGVDIRTVAGRLGHGGGGSTTLRVYAAWLSEADQRASGALLARVPDRPTPLPPPAERAKTDPQAPYEQIAAQLRSEILTGQHRPGEPAPTVKDVQLKHGVGAGTAHCAIGLLKTWGLVDASRGRRGVILAPIEPAATLPPEPRPNPEPTPGNDQPTLLSLRLLYLGADARVFTAKADPAYPDQLHRLLSSAARRHRGTDADVADYELEVRHVGDDRLITTFAAL